MPETTVWLEILLKSDTALGRGDGLAGVVNAEVQHDLYGLPFLAGKTLKGLLTAGCAELMFSLERISDLDAAPLDRAAAYLFGHPDGGGQGAGMYIDDACLPRDFRDKITMEFRQLAQDHRDHEDRREREIYRKKMELLHLFTAIRSQTAIDATGAPRLKSLRATRVVLRETPLIARVDLVHDGDALPDEVKGLLAGCARALRRVGSHRNRGLGRVIARLYSAESCLPESELTQGWLALFEETLNRKAEVAQ